MLSISDLKLRHLSLQVSLLVLHNHPSKMLRWSCYCFQLSWLQQCYFGSAVNKGRSPAKRAGYWPIFGRLLSSHLTVNFGNKRKIRKRSNKNNCETSASNVWVEMKAHFRSLNVFTFPTRNRSWSKVRGTPATFSQNRIQHKTGLK